MTLGGYDEVITEGDEHAMTHENDDRVADPGSSLSFATARRVFDSVDSA